MATILVTGGAGFIGSHTVDALIAEGHDVIVIDNFSSGKRNNIHPKAKWYDMNICDPALRNLFEQYLPDYVYHFAAQINVRQSVKDPHSDAITNILGSLNILENARHIGVKKFIFASTGGAIYGDANIIPTPETCLPLPLSPYGIAKKCVENYLRFYEHAYHLAFTILRYANVYGPRQDNKGEAGVVSMFIDAFLKGKQPLITGDGCQTRDFIFVDDVVQANLLALHSKSSDIYNVGTGQETSVNELFLNIKNQLNSHSEAQFAPLPDGEVRRSCLDITKIQKELSFSPVFSLTDGIYKTISWWKR